MSHRSWNSRRPEAKKPAPKCRAERAACLTHNFRPESSNGKFSSTSPSASKIRIMPFLILARSKA